MQQQADIFAEQCEILKQLSEKSDCVIVGRCGDYILADRNPCRVFVYSDMESKIERCRLKGRESGPISDKDLRHHIRIVNRQREGYYNFFTGQAWGSKMNYDLCINTTKKDMNEISPYLSQICRQAGAV